MKIRHLALLLIAPLLWGGIALGQVSEQQLEQWRQRFPQADTNNDGLLTREEARAYQQQRGAARGQASAGALRQSVIDPGWQAERFPDHAVCYKTPEEIAAIYKESPDREGEPVTSYEKPADGSLRIVGTGHSFMASGYRTFPAIARAAGLIQPMPLLHTSGGETGGPRYKWEEENGIFQFDGKPTPKLLASIANAQWDAMMIAPYEIGPEFFTCWIDFCLKYNPGMKFYILGVWPTLAQLDERPASEEELSDELLGRLGREREAMIALAVNLLDEKYPGRIFVLPVSRAMVLAAQYYHRGELPGVEGINTIIGGKEHSLWHDQIGHLGPGFDTLEGYVFYATLYGRSPELIEGDVDFGRKSDYPSQELDRIFRKIAWQAVTGDPLSGVTDNDGDGVADGSK